MEKSKLTINEKDQQSQMQSLQQQTPFIPKFFNNQFSSKKSSYRKIEENSSNLQNLFAHSYSKL